MKRFMIFAVTAALLIAVSAAMSGCSACSRELDDAMSEASSMLPSVSEPESVPEVSSEPPIPSEPSSEMTPSEMPETSSEASALAMSADFLQIGALSSELVPWGPGTFQDEKGRSTACVDLQEQYGSYNADFIGPEDCNTVTLTFDQGYENGYTEPILDTLKEKGVTAVFFLTGHYLRSQPELVQRMIDEGHIIGSHSDSHAVYVEDLSLEESFEDAKGMQEALREDYGYEMRLFRFPEGAFCEQSLALMQQMGYKSLFWSFAYADWDVNNQPEPAAAMERIEKFIHPGEIMLLHSVSSTNAEILGGVIDMIRSKGYEVGPYEGML